MLKKLNDFLSGRLMTAIAGLFLLIDLIPHISSLLGKDGLNLNILPFDPAWITILICGIPLLYLALWRVVHNPGISKISSALLICVAMFAAIGIGDLFAAGEVVFIMSIGALLEDATTERAKKGLHQLISLAPVQARRIRNGKEEMIDARDIHVGDILRVLPGETIPADGCILTGESSVNQSIMTGESLPVDKVPGDSVFCGTVNCFGSVDLTASKVGQDSSLQKMIHMVQEAEQKQAPMQRIADKCASWLTPVAMMIAVFAYIFTRNIVTSVTILVVFCPCALVLATPTAIMAAIGQATKHGVIIKSGEALEKMGKADTIAFDKTGTLTCGQLSVSDLVSLRPGLSEEELLRLTASAEGKSEHPLGKAILANAREKGLSLTDSEAFRMIGGRGIHARVEGRNLLCGNERFMKENGILITDAAASALEKLHRQGKASVILAEGCTVLGITALSDVLRDEAPQAISRLTDMNTQTVLLTGDHSTVANHFAGKLGLTQVRAELLPEEKVRSIEDMQQEGKIVCMVGDGVNDAPALKTADVSVAMGTMGSDIAVDAADVILVGDDISRLPYLKRLSDATVRTIKVSITLSMCINALAITLSLLQLLTPTTGALVHNAGSCFVVLIAALLYDRKFD